jgi:hypothetical protein
LPMSYSTCRFALPAEAPSWKTQFCLRRKALDFLHNTSADNIARIRSLCVSFDADLDLWGYFIRIAIEINDDKRAVKISFFDIDGNVFEERTSKAIICDVDKLLKRKPRALIRAIAAREGPSKLRKKDIHPLLKSLWSAMLEGVEAHPKGTR